MKKMTKLAILGVVVICVVVFVWGQRQKKGNFISPLSSDAKQQVVLPDPPSSQGLENVVGEALEGTKGTYGVVIVNLKSGESYYSNSHRQFLAGSLYKLWVMGEAYHQIEQGTLEESELLSRDVALLNKEFNIATEAAEMTDGTITLTVGQALRQMITISHNYAALILSERVKLSNVRKFLADKGISESIVEDPPKTTAADTALFLKKLYHGELGDSESTQSMLGLLKDQELRGKLPKYLPENVEVANKTGEIDYFSHDAGIVYGPKGDFVIVVLSESDLPSAAEERIATLSKRVYDYFSE